MEDEFFGRMTLTYIESSGGAGGGYLISDQPIRTFLERETTPCINVLLKKAFESLPALGFSLHSPERIRAGELVDPENLGLEYLICVYNDPSMPAWCFQGAQNGDRLRMRFDGADGHYTAQFRLNHLPPTRPYDVLTSAPIYFLIKVDSPRDVAILTEDETVNCRAMGAIPFNRLSFRKLTPSVVGKKSTRLSQGAGQSPTQAVVPQPTPMRMEQSPSSSGLPVMKRAVFPECVVCTDGPVELLNFPCQHAVSCVQCYDLQAKSVAPSENKCHFCRKKVVHTRPIYEKLDRCAFDGCSVLDAAAMSCGCVVGCFAQATKLNGFFQRGEPPPRCPACQHDVSAYYQVYFP